MHYEIVVIENCWQKLHKMVRVGKKKNKKTKEDLTRN